MAYVAEALGIEGASVRVKLRKSEFEKTGRAWGWDTKKEADDVVKALKSEEKAEPAEGEEGTAKPKRGRKKAA